MTIDEATFLETWNEMKSNEMSFFIFQTKFGNFKSFFPFYLNIQSITIGEKAHH